MCGIFGVAGDVDKKEVDLFFGELLDANQERGQSAYGITLAYQRGTVVKKGRGILDKNQASIYYREVPDSWRTFLPRALLGHTRAPTEGAPIDYDNNHPFQINSLYLAHNGILINHKEVRQSLLPFLRSSIVTDSYVLLGTIWKEYRAYGEIPSRLSDAIVAACETIKGSFACWLWRNPDLYLFRCISSLYYRHDKYLPDGTSALVFSSERLPGGIELPEGIVLHFNTVWGYLERSGKFSYYSPYHLK